jgi:hypothetical protein
MKISEIIISEDDKQFKTFHKIQPKISDCIENGVNRWHFIYINDDPRQCVHMAGFSENLAPKELNFKHAFNAIKRKHYSDLLLLLTYYGHMDNSLLVEKINQPKIPIDHLTALLFNETSNGYLAYGYQLEQVYSTLTGATAHESIQFRRDWNKKKHSAIDLVKSIAYNKELSLFDYIRENCFYEEGPFFLNANFQQAKLLYESLMN